VGQTGLSKSKIDGNPDGTIHYLELFQAELTTSFYLEPFRAAKLAAVPAGERPASGSTQAPL
jgi:hypothetical protein